jgi:hypothetical protein
VLLSITNTLCCNFAFRSPADFTPPAQLNVKISIKLGMCNKSQDTGYGLWDKTILKCLSILLFYMFSYPITFGASIHYKKASEVTLHPYASAYSHYMNAAGEEEFPDEILLPGLQVSYLAWYNIINCPKCLC